MTTIQSQNPYEPSSAQSTPGFEVPGAFPREHTRQHPLSDSHRAAERQQPISLPSSEKEGAQPGEHCGGVGPLPGTSSETSVAKLPDERASEVKAAAAPSSRTKEVFADEDDPREDVAPISTSAAKVPDEQAGESEVAAELASASKELAADTGRGDDTRESVVAAAAAPGVTEQDSLVRKTDTQGGPAAVDEQAPRAETTGTADQTSPAESKFKEELRREEKTDAVFDEGARPSPPSQTQVSPAGDLAMAKGTDEESAKTAPVQQQQQKQQPEIVGGQPPPQRKGRSSSDSDASNHVKETIMNRVKGEMKVLLGKASGNKEKVEAGERMKQGTQ